MLQQQWPWLTPSGRPPTHHVSSIKPSHQLHTALIFDKQNCNSLLMYVSWLLLFFCFKREMCETLWKFRDVLFFCHSNTDLAIVFFLTREIKLVIIYCHDVDDDYDHLFTRCTRCPPACLRVHERSDDRMTECRRTWWRQWWRYRECLCYCYNVECFFLFLSMRDSWEMYVSVCVCIWTLICSSQGSEKMLIWWLAFREKEGVCVCGCVHVCVLDCLDIVIAKKFKNIGTIAYVS